ncbi:MAG: hypothetical protein NT027_20820, partial [Proteobacteria bacterium]|nr:hypothetical protein [Pseudomonadota bacterium]
TCKPRKSNSELEGNVSLSKEVPTQVLYHFGEFKHLSKFGDRDSGPTPSEWIEIPSVKYYLPYRQGFYAGQHPAYNERYANDHLYKDRSLAPWIVKLEISKECQEKGNVGADIAELESDSRFVQWIQNYPKFRGIQNFRRQCEPSTTFKFEAPETECTKALASYFDIYGIKVVSDHLWPGEGFWIIRRPECIKKMSSSPARILDEVPEIPELFKASPYTTNRQRNPGRFATATEGLLHIFVRAVYEAATLTQAQEDKWRKSVEDSDYPETTTTIKSILNAVSRCRNQPSTGTNFKSILNDYLSTTERTIPATGPTLSIYSERMKSLTGRMEGLCPSANGGGNAQIAQASSQPDLPSIFSYICLNFSQFEKCKEEEKRVNAILSNIDPKVTRESTAITTVYLTDKTDKVWNPTSSTIELKFGSAKDVIERDFRDRVRIVADANAFTKKFKDASINCYSTSSLDCVKYSILIRSILVKNEKYTKDNLDFSTLFVIDSNSLQYLFSTFEVKANLNESQLIATFDERIDNVSAARSFARTFPNMVVGCSLSHERCRSATQMLQRFFRDNPQFTSNSLSLSDLKIADKTNIFDSYRLELSEKISASDLKSALERRLLWLAEKKSYDTKYSGISLLCGSILVDCTVGLNTMYTYAHRSDAISKDLIKVASIHVGENWKLFSPSSIEIKMNAKPDEIHSRLIERSKYLDLFKYFEKTIPTTSLYCSVPDPVCEITKLRIVEVFFENKHFTKENMGYMSIDIGNGQTTRDIETSIISINVNASKEDIRKYFQARAAKKGA